ncbi:cobyric acid synthase [Vagococcus hydrophili]|uniref:Cobyric acid synthase n=1 Tax=Vagococcus hydrophili TaxID=2714947 RepID=A0A6G8AUN9_9ENTE|nr:cobyric acid synthase [Vagococcus hydrophili]QIL48655.1 cobyric acid synthase [Vagococcus hydrophili]
MVKSIMVQGTASDVGKSILVAGLCRIFSQDGLECVPFKSQNMALNSYITLTGHEMGRAQVFQSEAAGKEADVRMNPVLLKPTSDRKSQVIFNGKVLANMDAVEYHEFKPTLSHKISEIYQELGSENDVVVIEGAGSPAEINLNSRDIANMGMAKIADAPVILVADIDRGGVFASIYGTVELLEKEERARVKGVIINKFRGDKALLDPGLEMIEDLTNIPVLGVVPYEQFKIEDEDSVALKNVNRLFDSSKKIDVAVVSLSKMSNFTDFNSLELEPDVSVRYVFQGDKIGQPDVLIIPGSKNTLEDSLFLKESGLAQQIQELRVKGTYILGICGGYQLLGEKLHDPQKMESETGSVDGLGLLPVETTIQETKVTAQVEGMRDELKVTGYEIHMGETLLKTGQPFAEILKENNQEIARFDGAVSEDGKVIGTYLHGIFDGSDFRHDFFNQVRDSKGLEMLTEKTQEYKAFKEEQYDKLADCLRQNLDMEKIYEIINQSDKGSV